MIYYVEAYGAKARPILGNLDGQTVLRAKNWQRTAHVKRLSSGEDRPKWEKVQYWLVRSAYGDKPIGVIYNRFHHDQ